MEKEEEGPARWWIRVPRNLVRLLWERIAVRMRSGDAENPHVRSRFPFPFAWCSTSLALFYETPHHRHSYLLLPLSPLLFYSIPRESSANRNDKKMPEATPSSSHSK